MILDQLVHHWYCFHSDVKEPRTSENEYPHCEHKFQQSCSLRRHVRHKHKNVGYGCVLYGKKLSHNCHICNKNYKTKHGLATHIRQHENNYRYTCYMSGRQFSYKTELDTHVAKESGEPSFQCTDCQKYLSNSSNLSRHKSICKIATKSSKNGICPKLFKTRRYMKEPVERKHGTENGYQCS